MKINSVSALGRGARAVFGKHHEQPSARLDSLGFLRCSRFSLVFSFWVCVYSISWLSFHNQNIAGLLVVKDFLGYMFKYIPFCLFLNSKTKKARCQKKNFIKNKNRKR